MLFQLFIFSFVSLAQGDISGWCGSQSIGLLSLVRFMSGHLGFFDVIMNGIVNFLLASRHWCVETHQTCVCGNTPDLCVLIPGPAASRRLSTLAEFWWRLRGVLCAGSRVCK